MNVAWGAWIGCVMASGPSTVEVRSATHVGVHLNEEAMAPALHEVGQERSSDMAIEAERVTWSPDGSDVVFEGAVSLRMGILNLTTTRVMASWSGERIDGVEAQGGVQLTRGDLKATARSAQIDVEGRAVQLQGEVTLIEQGRTMYADQVSLDLDTGALDCHTCRVVLPLSPEGSL